MKSLFSFLPLFLFFQIFFSNFLQIFGSNVEIQFKNNDNNFTSFETLISKSQKRQLSVSCQEYPLERNDTGYECSACVDMGGLLLDIKNKIDWKDVSVRLGSLLPPGTAAWEIPPIPINLDSTLMSVLGIPNQISLGTIDATAILNLLPAFTVDASKSMVEEAVNKILSLGNVLGKVCFRVYNQLCDPEIGILVDMKTLNDRTVKVFELNFRPSREFDASCDNTNDEDIRILYDREKRELSVCKRLFFRLFNNDLCLSLTDLIYGMRGIHFVPVLKFSTSFPDVEDPTFTFDPVSYGQVDNCFKLTDCNQCLKDTSCGWCNARQACVSLNEELNTCGGCVSGFSQTCDQELVKETQACSNFPNFDQNSDWVLTREEWEGTTGTWLSASESQRSFENMDTNRDSLVQYSEYCTFQKSKGSTQFSAGWIALIIALILISLVVAFIVAAAVLKKKDPEQFQALKNKVLRKPGST